MDARFESLDRQLAHAESVCADVEKALIETVGTHRVNKRCDMLWQKLEGVGEAVQRFRMLKRRVANGVERANDLFREFEALVHDSTSSESSSSSYSLGFSEGLESGEDEELDLVS